MLWEVDNIGREWEVILLKEMREMDSTLNNGFDDRKTGKKEEGIGYRSFILDRWLLITPQKHVIFSHNLPGPLQLLHLFPDSFNYELFYKYEAVYRVSQNCRLIGNGWKLTSDFQLKSCVPKISLWMVHKAPM